MTGATGDLTPDEAQRDFVPGEWREASDAEHAAEVTRAQAAAAPAQRGEIGEPGEAAVETGPTELAGRESGYGSTAGLSPEDPAYQAEVRPASPHADELTEGSAEDPRRQRDTRIGGDDLSEREEHL